jgi:hypothetical protein
MGMALLVAGWLAAGCGDDASGLVLVADAEFDPAAPADAFAGVSEASPAVAQTFTVLADGKLERLDVVVTRGPSADSGLIRVDVRPTDAMGMPELSPATAIASLELDTTTLPPTLVEQFTTLDFGDQPGRQVLAGGVYAIVVEFMSRSGSTDALAIATVLGVSGDPYPDGGGFTGASNVGFVANTDDYLFRSFSLQ